MGMEISVQSPGIDWGKITNALAQFEPRGTLRMADGQLTFPDEEPASGWRELRVALPAGMVTLRRTPQGVDLVTWGNISEDLFVDRDRLASLLAG
jgi:hypothetical protein